MFPQNAGKFLSEYMVSHPRKQQSWQEIANNLAFNTFLQK
jgi:hypothetical protein